MVTDLFKKQMLEKREKFFERAHAAFVLNTSFIVWGILDDADKGWLWWVYPNSTIQTGIDQGVRYYTITPKF